jgi:hypothetical protein
LRFDVYQKRLGHAHSPVFAGGANNPETRLLKPCSKLPLP